MKSKANRRSLRTIAQFVVGGGFTALVTAVANGLEPYVLGIVLATCTVMVTWGQNYLEDHEVVPTFLPAPPPQDPGA